MKKIIALTALSLFFASTCFASGALTLTLGATPVTGKTVYGAKTGTATTSSPVIGKSSNGVGVGMATSTVGYSAITQHKNGTKAYGSANDSTSIYVIDATAGTAVSTPTATGVSAFTGSWTTM